MCTGMPNYAYVCVCAGVCVCACVNLNVCVRLQACTYVCVGVPA